MADADSFLARTSQELTGAPTAPRSERSDNDRHHHEYRDRDNRDSRNRDQNRDRDHRDRDRDHHHRDSRDHRDSRENQDRFRDRPHDRYRNDRSDRNFGRDSRRSRSPGRSSRSRGHREKTPDLTDVVPIDQRQRRRPLFDIKPPGYENVTSEMAKMSGVFPLPGSSRLVNYPKLQGLADRLPANGSSDSFQRGGRDNYRENNNQHAHTSSNLGGLMNLNDAVSSTALNASNSRTAKRVIVTGFVPADTAQEEVTTFFTEYLSHIKLDNPLEAGQSLIAKVHINDTLDSVVVEFTSAEVATIMVALDGIKLGYGDSGPSLSISRPEDYITPEGPEIIAEEGNEETVKSIIPDSAAKISIGNIPAFLSQDHILDLLTAFGPLSGFKLLQDTDGNSLGVAFCQFQDVSVTDTVCEGLNGMELADNSLVVRRACVGITQSASVTAGAVFGMASRANQTTTPKQSRVLLLLNMVTPEDLVDEDDYLDIKEDIEDECNKFGKVIMVKIPRPAAASGRDMKDLPDSVGKIFVKFDTTEACQAAAKALAGRKFSDRTVLTTFYSEQNFDLDAF